MSRLEPEQAAGRQKQTAGCAKAARPPAPAFSREANSRRPHGLARRLPLSLKEQTADVHCYVAVHQGDQISDAPR
jgi:hypothetical protein